MEELYPAIPEPAIDGPWRVDTYQARISPGRNGGGMESVRFSDHRAMAIYSPFAGPALGGALRHILKWSHGQPSSVIPLLVDRFGVLSAAQGLSELRNEPSRMELVAFLKGLVGYGWDYRALLAQARLSWSANGKYLLAVIPLSSDEISDLELQSLILEILELTENTPLRPLLILDNPRLVPREIEKKLSWQAFLGDELMSYAQSRFSVRAIAGMEGRVEIGTAIDRSLKEIRTLNGLTFEPTAEALERSHAVADDAASYERFLEELIDGK